MAEMILVVDDETEIADLVEVYLKNEGYLVKKASCAAEALHIADTQPIALGADDYITKPFNPLEVVARVKTQLRRYIRYNQTAPEPAPAAVYDCGELYIDHESHTCTLYSKPLSLTPLEFEILWYLCSRKGHVVSSEELFEAVWGEKYLDSNNTVMAHIARLREKMGELPRKPKWIKTVWGVGYKIDE